MYEGGGEFEAVRIAAGGDRDNPSSSCSLRFMTEKEKNVDKLTDEWIPIYQNLTGLV